MKRFLLFLTLMFTITSCENKDTVLHGYVEGEYVYVTPKISGTLSNLSVHRGQNVEIDDDLFYLDDVELKIKVNLAKAELAKSKAKLNNLLKGKRLEEIAVILEQKSHAKASFEKLEKEYKRAETLLSKKVISQAEFENIEEQYKLARDSLDIIEAKLKIANLGARKHEIQVAEAEVEIALQNLTLSEEQLQDTISKAPAKSYVEDIFFQNGEFVPAGKAVISLLPPENVKIRFFISQKKLAEVSYNKIITIKCDGCVKQIKAKINFISSQAEYTPPVIYSTDSREKLVYMIEAIPVSTDVMLRPGLPVDIYLEEL